MFRNYLAIALRSISRKPGYAAINLIGLAVGMAAFFVITLFVRDELSYDRFHDHADRIVRLTSQGHTSSGDLTSAQTVPSWAPALADRIPEIEQFVRIKPPNQMWLVTSGDRKFFEKGFVFMDSTGFDVFSFDLVRGDPGSALNAPFTVVISESAAAKFFGKEDPLGRFLRLDNQYDFEVTGIMRDTPEQSHFKADYLASMSTLREPIYGDNYLDQPLNINAYTYFLLAEGADPDAVMAKIDAFILERVGPMLESVGATLVSNLQPLTSIHLDSHLDNEILPNGSRTTVIAMSAIALFILLIACINYMNLATARAAQRTREVGMRKVLGAERKQLIFQFLGESVVMSVTAMLFGVLLVWLLLPVFNTASGKNLSLLSQGFLSAVLIFVGAAVGSGVLAGSYPAFFLSSFRPARVLKSGASRVGGGGMLRKSLVTAQFVASILMIAGTVGVFKQLEFTRTFDLGFDQDQTIVVQMTDPGIRASYRTFRERVDGLSAVASVSAATSAPGYVHMSNIFAPEGAPPEDQRFYQFFGTDFGFLETMGIDLVAGRSFSRDYPSDTLGSVMINRSAVEDLGWGTPEDAVGKRISQGGGNRTAPVVGVFDDFHAESLHEAVRPAVMAWVPDQGLQFAIIRLRGGQVTDAIEEVGQIWNDLYPAYIYQYSFMDDDVDALYASDLRLGRMFGGFAILTIIIACLGLFGLASFTAEQRTKEVGVRKVMGASVPGIVLLLSREFTRYVAIAFFIAAPIAWFGMQNWLDSFSYRTEFGPLTLLLIGLAALAVSWLTVSWQTVRAAVANPVDSLRYE